MSLISRREQTYLLNWAKTAGSRMAEGAVSNESYFEKRTNEENYLVEYSFDIVDDMDEMMQKVLGNVWDEKLRKVCEVAALKERSRHIEERKINCDKNQNKAENQIPEFIYNF